MSDLLDWLTQNEPSFRKSRLPSLYSDLSLQRTTNPDGYTANITAWQTALDRAALTGYLCSSSTPNNKNCNLVLHTSDDLLQALSSPQYGRPLGLAAVINEGVKAGKMIPVKHFLGAERSIYTRNWVPSPWTVLNWGLRQIGLVGEGTYETPGGKLRVGDLVLVGALEKVAGNVIAAQEKRSQGLTDRVMSRETFGQELAKVDGVTLSDQDRMVLLRFLERDKQAISYDEQTVKFRSPASTTPEAITSQDATIASLKTLLSHLATQCNMLSSRITTFSTTATAAVKSGNRVSALSALRSKKLAEKNLQQRSETLHQLEEVYAKIEQAADQVEVVRVMEASVGVLRGLNKQVGGVEAVEDVVEQLREEMVHVDEVGGVLREGVNPNTVLDEWEIDDELEQMEKEQREKNEQIEAEKRRKNEEIEAERTRKRLDELERTTQTAKAKEAEEQAEKQKKLDELEQRAMRWKESQQPGPAAEEKRSTTSTAITTADPIDESVKRLSEISFEDDGAEPSLRKEKERQVVPEGAS